MSSFNQSDWSFPKKVQTPNIKEDIKTYLSDDILSKFNACTNQEVKDKIVRVTEMLEFIGHLNAISGFLHSKDKKEVKCVGNNIYVISHIEFESHDYSGFDYDCEALTIYLLLSLIDTCVGQEKYVTTKDYIAKELKENNNNKDEVIDLLEQYNDKYGLSKNFKKAFTDYISPSLKKEICSSLFYFDPPKEENILAKIEERYSKWGKMNDEEKLKKIAAGLYSIRSKYTHSNIRCFIPDKDNNQICAGDKECFFCKKGTNFDAILKKVIIDLINSLIDGKLAEDNLKRTK